MAPTFVGYTDRDTLIEQSATLIEQSTTISLKTVGSSDFSNTVKVSKNTLPKILTFEMFPGGKPPDPHKYHSHLLYMCFILTSYIP